ncbi:MAG: amino acid permease [Vicinamibacterales bacterium]
MSAPAQTQALRRALGKWDLTAIGVNQVIGSAIFLIQADVARIVGSWGPVMFLGIGLSSLFVALCFAEVGSRFESTGGPIGPARVAFGRFVGFEVGWMLWFSRVSSGASVINGMALALGYYWPVLSTGPPRTLVILAVLGALTWINVRGIRQTSWLVNTFTIGKLLPLVVFVLVGAFYFDPGRIVPSDTVSIENLGAAALLLIFAYGGYEVTGVPAGEASNPKKDVPFAFIATILIASGVMTLTAAVAAGLLPDLTATRTPIADASALVMGAFGGLLVSVGSVVSMTGNNMGQLLSGSRTVFALAEGGDLPPVFARVHPVYRTPHVAIWFTSIVLVVLALTGSVRVHGGGERGGAAGGVLSACGATLRLRRADMAGRVAPAEFTAPLGPVIPAVAIAITLSILAGATVNQLLSGVAALAAGGRCSPSRPGARGRRPERYRRFVTAAVSASSSSSSRASSRPFGELPHDSSRVVILVTTQFTSHRPPPDSRTAATDRACSSTSQSSNSVASASRPAAPMFQSSS